MRLTSAGGWAGVEGGVRAGQRRRAEGVARQRTEEGEDVERPDLRAINYDGVIEVEVLGQEAPVVQQVLQQSERKGVKARLRAAKDTPAARRTSGSQISAMTEQMTRRKTYM